MKLKSLSLSRQYWGADKDQISGSITFDDPYGEVMLKLKPQDCNEILEVCAARLSAQTLKLSQEMSEAIRNDTILLPLINSQESTSENSN